VVYTDTIIDTRTQKNG